MKIENKNISRIKDINYNKIVEDEKEDFSMIVKKFQNQQRKKFSVYAIAAKIARGESVSAEELTYIRENAPSLLEEAKRQNEERKEAEVGNKQTVKEAKSTKALNEAYKGAIKTEDNSIKVDDDKQPYLL